jgi:YrbI family 3-deoxy-D-manno-octulosonate 8-phosphate phosphatase
MLKKNKIKQIKLIAFDFDGVFTNNKVYVDSNGNEMVECSRSEWTTAKYIQDKIPMCVISTEVNIVTQKRCEKLKLKCFHGITNKLQKLQEYANELNIKPENIAFVGNDVNDLACLQWVGIPIIVQDAHKSIKNYPFMVTKCCGGKGAVREIIDTLIEVNNVTTNFK